jgi:hypothetical protein
MRLKLAALAFLPLLASTPASAATVLDPIGDFLPTFVGPRNADLDVTSFSVNFNPDTSRFLLSAVLAGPIDPSTPGFYVIGVNTGTGPTAPFGSIGQPNVAFNQVIVVQKDGTGAIFTSPLEPGAVTLAGNAFTASVHLARLPSTGSLPQDYGFNIWPRIALGNNNQIGDFAPNNALLRVVPEPSTWAMMLLGFGAIGAAMRSAKRKLKVSLSYA